MRRVIVALVIGVGLALPGRTVGQQSAEEAVIAVVEALFEGMASGDTEALRAIMLPQSQLLAMGDNGPRWSTGASFAEAFAGRDVALIERMWNPTVLIDGPIASLWTPYDLYIGDRWSHCGTDAVQLVLTDHGWRVAFLSYTTRQPPDCERHPEGPPGAR